MSPLFIFLLLTVISSSPIEGDVDYGSPLVFDANFYFNTHRPIMHDIHTEHAAKHHWLTHGIDAGLQAIGSFHSKQYLLKYKDLSAAFHTNYRQAVRHFLTNGTAEHRVGVVSHYQNRWSIYAHDITIGTSRRMGGAIDSLTWNHKEFVNAYDHGREIQMACNSDTYTECYNPTEAGGRNDGGGNTTYSHIKWVKAHGNVLKSEVNPAFWLRPGMHEKRSPLCRKGTLTVNHQRTYSYPFHKKVTIGSHGIKNCVRYDSNFTLGGDWPLDLQYIQMEAPAIYLNGDMNKIYNFRHDTNLVENYHTNHHPAVLSTPDHQYALGVYSPPGQPSDAFMYYGAKDFHMKAAFSATTKMNVVYRRKRFEGNGPVHYIYTTYLCVGTLNHVSDCLGKIMTAVPRM